MQVEPYARICLPSLTQDGLETCWVGVRKLQQAAPAQGLRARGPGATRGAGRGLGPVPGLTC